MARCGGVEAGRPVLDGVEAIAGQGFVDRKLRALKGLRGKPFDRIAIDGVDFPIFEAHAWLLTRATAVCLDGGRKSAAGSTAASCRFPHTVRSSQLGGSCRLIVDGSFA